ncbi:MAG: DUF4838 domain-containing protein [Planctomycetota bacterium]
MVTTPIGVLAAAQGLLLVEDGQAKSVIVVPDDASPAAVAGAEIMQKVILRMSGATLEIVRESSLGVVHVERGRLVPQKGKGAAAFVLIGEGLLANRLGVASEGLGPGGVRIKTFENAMAFLGGDAKTPSDPWGTRYAVTGFLDETLGCKFLWPGENGLAVPQRKTISVPFLDVAFTPLLRQRRIRSLGYSDRIQEGLNRLSLTKQNFIASRTVETADWFDWHRMGGSLGLEMGDGSILPREVWNRIQKEHPEWLAMQADGSREPAPHESRPRLCKSNPALVEAIVQEKIKELRTHPGQSSISLMTHDGGYSGFCLCPACKAMDPTDGRPTKIWTFNHENGKVERFDYVSLTDRMFSFYNAIAERVAKEFPDVLFCGQAYSVYSAPPVRVKLHPNVVIRFVGIDYLRDSARREGREDWNVWTKVAAKVLFRPNLLLAGRREGTPVVYAHKLAEDFRYMAHGPILGTDFDACAHNWSTQGLNYYILAKLHWNPDLDVDAEINDYCRAGFGDGWEHVKCYLMRLEQLTNRIAAEELEVTEPYTPQVIAELHGYLDAAKKAVGDNPTVTRRIAFLRCGLEFTALQAEAYQILRQTKVRPLPPEQRAAARELMDRRWAMMRKIFRDDPYAVNVAYVAWGEGECFAPLGWSGPSPRARQTVEADERGRPLE